MPLWQKLTTEKRRLIYASLLLFMTAAACITRPAVYHKIGEKMDKKRTKKPDIEDVDGWADAILKASEKRYRSEFNAMRKMIEERGASPEEVYRIYKENKLEELKKELEMGIQKPSLGMELSSEERAYLAGLVFLDKEFNFSQSFPSIVYECLRCAGLIEDRGSRRRSQYGKYILDKLTRKDLVIHYKYDGIWEGLTGMSIPVHFYKVRDNKNTIQSFYEYRKLEDSREKMSIDLRFKEIFDQAKEGINKMERDHLEEVKDMKNVTASYD